MADWLTALGGAGVAYVGGVLTKPLQTWIEERRERRRLRKALYVEMGTILSHCHYVIGELRRDVSISNYWDIYLKGLWPSHCFEMARANPISLNLLPDIKGINHFFKGLEALADAHQIMQKENRSMFFFTVVFLTSVLAIRCITEDGELSKDELIKSGDSKTAALLQGVPDLEEMIQHSDA